MDSKALVLYSQELLSFVESREDYTVSCEAEIERLKKELAQSKLNEFSPDDLAERQRLERENEELRFKLKKSNNTCNTMSRAYKREKNKREFENLKDLCSKIQPKRRKEDARDTQASQYKKEEKSIPRPTRTIISIFKTYA